MGTVKELVTIGLLALVGFIVLTLPYAGWRDWCYITSLLPATFSEASRSTIAAWIMIGMLWVTLGCWLYWVATEAD